METSLIATSGTEINRAFFGLGGLAFAMFLYGRSKICKTDHVSEYRKKCRKVMGLVFNYEPIEASLFRAVLALISLAMFLGITAFVGHHINVAQPIVSGIKAFYGGYVITGLIATFVLTALLRRKRIAYVSALFFVVLALSLIL